MENEEQDGFESGIGSSINPIRLRGLIVTAKKKKLPWYKSALKSVGRDIQLMAN